MCGIFGVQGHAGRGRADAPRAVLAAAPRPGIGGHRRRRRATASRAACADMGLVSEASTAHRARRAPRRRSPSGTRATAPPAPRRSRTRSRCSRASRGGHIALAHNGNLTNATELRARARGPRARSSRRSMDSEVIVHRLARSHGDNARGAARRRARAASRARTASLVDRSATRCSPRAIRAAGVRS